MRESARPSFARSKAHEQTISLDGNGGSTVLLLLRAIFRSIRNRRQHGDARRRVKRRLCQRHLGCDSPFAVRLLLRSMVLSKTEPRSCTAFSQNVARSVCRSLPSVSVCGKVKERAPTDRTTGERTNFECKIQVYRVCSW